MSTNDGTGVVTPRAAAFANIADTYEAGRKPYPPEPIEWAYAELGLDGSSTVLDLAAGTGKLSRVLAPLAGRLIAVEPLVEMRRILVEQVPEAELHAGTAEAIPLADGEADAVFVGAAFHWFDAEPALAEIHRVLRPGGGLAIVYARRGDDVPWKAQLAPLVEPLRNGAGVRPRHSAWRAKVEASSLFTPLELHEFPMTVRYTVEDYRNLMGSFSFVGALAPDQRERLLDQIEQIVRAHGEGPFDVTGRVEVFVTRSVA